MPVTYTPLRYPGGKSSLYPVVSRLIKYNGMNRSTYVEPFAGGAGLALKLLLRGEVPSIVLNDLDPAIAAIWSAVIHCNSNGFIRFIKSVPLNIEEWERQHNVYVALRAKALSGYAEAIVKNSDRSKSPLDFITDSERFDLACAAFYMNRTNRSGIMAGGPIGGKGQRGKYRLDARFNREGLTGKVINIADHADSIRVYNLDVSDFAHEVITELTCSGAEGAFVYFDPPYVGKGPGLYQNSLTEKDHRDMAELISSCSAKWMVTYDECPLTKELYESFSPQGLSIGYCAYRVQRGREILVLGPGLETCESIEELLIAS